MFGDQTYNWLVRKRVSDCIPKARAIKRTSGGIGKKEDSDKDKINKAGTPYLVLDHSKTQLYSLLI